MATPSSIYSFRSCADYLRWWVSARPKGGRGEMAKMAESLGISAALYSQMLSGDRHFTQEGGVLLSEYLALGDKETDYLLMLIDLDRAGSQKLKVRILAKLTKLQEESEKISNRIHKDGELSSETRATYYSSWTYTAVRNLTAVPGYQTVDAIAERLSLPKPIIAKVIEFLLETGLCKTQEGGGITYGPSWTHLGTDSRLVSKHHQNWRIRALTKMETGREEDMFFTGPMSLSHEVAKEIRRRLPTVIEDVQKLVQPSDSETIRCLNIDWFEY